MPMDRPASPPAVGPAPAVDGAPECPPGADPGSCPTAAELSGRPEVREALENAGVKVPSQAPPVGLRHTTMLGAYVLLFLAAACFYYLLRLELIDLDERYLPLAKRLTLGTMASLFALGIARATDAFLIRRLHNATTRFNLHRVTTLLAGLAIFFIVLSVLSQTWYTALVSLGLLSLVLGFALQTPITSFIGWIYILVRTPYRVGDRIRIGEATGDVIDVSYLDTTLWEFGGEYLTTDHPSGRLIKFPNSKVLDSAVYNYSWPLFPYIWHEVKFQIGYDSDLDFVARTMQEVTEAELGDEMSERIAAYRGLLARTPVDELEVRERPSVFFRVAENTWLEAIVRYLVEPRHAGRVKNRLIRELLARLNAEPDKVRFPKGDAR
jgi:small-conductance mechanosensitive channel